jgi:hypothetical protein
MNITKKKVYCPTCKTEVGFTHHRCPLYKQKQQQPEQVNESDIRALLFEIISKLDKLIEERK